MAAKGKIPEVLIFGDDYDTPDGTCIRDYVHVCDLARAHVLAMQYLLNGGNSRPINLGTGKGTSVLEIVRAVEVATGKKVPHRFVLRRAGDPGVLVADASLVEKVLGWQADAFMRGTYSYTLWVDLDNSKVEAGHCQNEFIQNF